MFFAGLGIGFALAQTPFQGRVAEINEAIHRLSDPSIPLGQNLGSLAYRTCRLVVERADEKSPLSRLFPDTKENHWAYEYETHFQACGLTPDAFANGNFVGSRLYTQGEMAARAYYAYLSLQDMDGKKGGDTVQDLKKLLRLFNKFRQELDLLGIDSKKALANLEQALSPSRDDLHE